MAVVLQAKMVYFQTSNSLESQVDQGRGTKMQAVTFKNFLTTATLLRVQMGKRGTTEIAKYARTLPSLDSLHVANMTYVTNLMFSQKKWPRGSYCPIQYNSASSY